MEIALPVNLAEDFTPVLHQRYSPIPCMLPVTTYDRCFVTHSGVGFTRLRPITESLYPNVTSRTHSKFYRHAVREYFTAPRVVSRRPRLLLVHNHWSGGYHHWVADCLVKLSQVDPSEYTVVLPDDYPAFALQSLGKFPIRGVLSLPYGHGLSATNLTAVGNPNVSRYSSGHIGWLRDALVPRQMRSQTATERLYITRRHAARRRIANEDEVVALLTRYNFTVLDSEQLSFSTEVETFARCRALVSLHGAGLTNCVFMPPGGDVLELCRHLGAKTGEINTTYWHLSAAADQNYYYQFCQPVHGHRGVPNDADVIVDVARLERNVRAMLRI
jgi:capsular polysaccharide biosynthesis protein